MVLQEPACGSKTLLQDMQEAYEKGLVSEEAITEAVERLMEVRIRLGMMKDYPSPYEDITYDKVECPEHVKLSVEAARRSLVLLKNENAFLPLDKNKIQTVAVIGECEFKRCAGRKLCRNLFPLSLKARDFAIITQEGECVVRPGSYRIAIGGQQPDARSAKLTGSDVAALVVQRGCADTG